MSIVLTARSMPGAACFSLRSRVTRWQASRPHDGGAAALLCGFLAILLLFGAEARAADAGNDAKAWLNKVSASSQNLNYEGTFVYRRDDQLVTMHIIHVADEQGGRERLISLSGGQRELIRGTEGVVCIFPGHKQISINKGGLDRQFPSQLSGRFDGLEKSYRIAVAGSDRIAGRPARILFVEPKDNFRYGYRLWVDEKTGLLLQSDLVGEHGNAVEQVMFISLNIVDKATPEMVKAVTMSDEMRQSLRASKRQTLSPNAMSWRLGDVPKGFSLAERYQHHGDDKRLVEQLVLSDGMATISVFVEPLSGDAKPFEGASHMGAVNAFGSVVDAHQLTVVGEVPAATVRLIGHSLNFNEAGR